MTYTTRLEGARQFAFHNAGYNLIKYVSFGLLPTTL
jgi:hypothetical protein